MGGSNTLITFIIILIISNCPLKCNSHGNNGGNIKGVFVFGSSLVDNGNNNFLDVRARCNYLPYGIDFKDGPTGRWNNGKNVIDVLCDSLTLPYVPPFYDPLTIGPKIINGVDYASGASGILDSTGKSAGEVASMSKQLQNFEVTLAQLEAQLGQKREEFLKNYIIVVGCGGNDITEFLKNATHGPVEDFINTLIPTLTDQLKKMYSLGGRKFVLMSANPLGCYMAVRDPEKCNEEYNNAAITYSNKLRALTDTLPMELPASNYVFVNSFQIILDIINNPAANGFQNVNEACYVNTCGPFGCPTGWKVCENRDAYVFFDGVHPTQAVALIVGSKAFSSTLPADVHPINVQQLASL